MKSAYTGTFTVLLKVGRTGEIPKGFSSKINLLNEATKRNLICNCYYVTHTKVRSLEAGLKC